MANSVIVGETKICPHCGAVVNGALGTCPQCGTEFSDSQATSSIKALSEAINNERKKYMFGNVAKVITLFPVPTAKEDLVELAIYTHNNYLSSQRSSKNDGCGQAWRAKRDECVQKARLLYPNDPLVKSMATECSGQVRASLRIWHKVWIGIACFISLIVLLAIVCR